MSESSSFPLSSGHGQTADCAPLDEGLAGQILQSITDGYHAVDAQGRFIHINATAREMFAAQGTNPEELLGKRLFDEVFPEARETEAARAFERTLAEQTPTSVEHFYEPWQRWHFVRHFPTPEGGVATLFQDVTERKMLNAAHDTFRHLVVNAPFGVYVVDADFRLVQVSAGAQKVFSNVRPLLGRDFAEVMRILWPEPFASEALERFRHTLATGEPFRSARTIERRQDVEEVEAYDWKLERIMLPDGRFGVVCHFYDLSERQAAEARANFLSQLSRKLATVSNAQEINEIATRETGEFLKMTRCYFFDVAADAREVTVLPDWRRGGKALAGSFKIGEYGREERWAAAARGPIGIDDVSVHPWTKDFADKYPPLEIRAYALAPFLHQERWVAGIGISTDKPRVWRAEELSLLEDVMARVWPLIDRARTEERLRKSEEVLRAYVTASSDVVYRMSADWTVMYHLEGRDFIADSKTANPHWLREYIHPDDQTVVWDTIQEAIREKKTFELEHRVIRVDGTLGWTFSRAIPLLDARGGIVEWFGAASDVTEVKAAEVALRESEQRFRNMANHAPMMVWITDANGYCTFLSESWYAFTGQTPETGLGFGWVQATHPEDQRRAHDLFVKANEGRSPFQLEYRLRREDGEYRWALDAAFPRVSDEGEFLGYIGSVIDITERKLAEEALQRSEKRKTALIELSDKLRETSDPADLAYAAAEILGKTLNVSRCGYGTIHTADETIHIERDWNAPGIKSLAGVLHFRDYGSYIEDLKRGETVVFADAEKDPRTKANAAALKAINAQAVVNMPVREQGGFVALLYLNHGEAREWTEDELVFIRDVAERTRIAVERRRTEQALRASVEEAARGHQRAEAASRAKDDFLAALSHELRTPLNPVLLVASELAQDEGLPLGVREKLSMIQRNIGLEARLIDDLLDLTRITRGMVPMALETVNVHALLRHTEEIVGADLAGRRLELRMDLTATDFHIQGDSARLQQVFWNLLKNSVKFTPDGGRITIHTSNPGEGWLKIAVEDTGRGIPREALQRIFRAFDQGDLSGRHAFGGLGLGLSISKALVDLHGGTLHAASPGQGLGVTFTVEVATTAAPNPAELHPPQAAEKSRKRLRLLVVEDDETTLTVLTQLLRRRGHEVCAASTMTEALAAAANQKCDLVISDLGLPDGTGMDLMREIKRRHGWPGIALSGYGMEEDLRGSREAGFSAHLVKPVVVSEMIRVIEGVGG